MTVANVLALATMTAKLSEGRSFTGGGIFAGDHLDVTKDSSPAGSAVALVRLVYLLASSTVETRTLTGLARYQLRRVRDASHRAPVDKALASRSGESVRAVTKVGAQAIAASGTVEARIGVALVDAELAVGSSVTRRTDASVVVDAIDASAVVHARARGAIFIVRLAVGP